MTQHGKETVIRANKLVPKDPADRLKEIEATLERIEALVEKILERSNNNVSL